MVNHDLVMAAVIVLQVFGVLSSIDGLYIHLWRLKLHQRPDSYREHLWHTARALLFAPVVVILFAMPSSGALLWVGVGLIPLLSNSGRKVFLYASGGESLAVRWSAIGLLLQACAGAVLIPRFGGVGAAVSLAVSEAIIWWPLRHATTRPTTTIDAQHAAASVVSGFSRTF